MALISKRDSTANQSALYKCLIIKAITSSDLTCCNFWSKHDAYPGSSTSNSITMRNRATTPLSKTVCLLLIERVYPADSARKSASHGANTTCITCSDCAIPPPRPRPSSSKNSTPAPSPALTMASRFPRANGRVCSRAASAASCP